MAPIAMSKRLSISVPSRRRSGPSARGREEGAILRRAVLLVGGVFVLFAITLQAGDILRGGSTTGSRNSRQASDARANAGSEAAAAAQVRAKDRLARTTKALTDMRNLQAQARAAAGGANIPNGLTVGGLQRWEPGEAGFRWDGARAPVQRGANVDIKQTDPQAVLHWKSFNVGRGTTVNFDQSSGGADAGKWIAFNKVVGSTAPSQIRGQIRADGQVYIINQNGIIFGAGSQVNARTVVASALAINDRLIERGLLNQTKNSAEFLFDGGNPGASVVVEAGALLATPQRSDGSGGRIILAGPNVINAGTISTPGGQTILAAGRQVGFDIHSRDYPSIPGRVTPPGARPDPGLRGIDVYIGDVGTDGIVQNTGLVEIPTGSLIMAGRIVQQNAMVDARTTVSLNGRIDLLANYDAVANPQYDPEIAGQLAFLNRSTGTVRLGPGSVTRILPDFGSPDTTVGSRLPLRSQVNIQGRAIEIGVNSMLLAPNADIAIAAGEWRPIAQQNVERFAFTGGRVDIGTGAFIDVSGVTNIFVPLGNRIFEVELRGSELAMSPLQRASLLRGRGLLIDSRRSGSFLGRYWVGTPLGDATGFLDVIQKNVEQLAADGGSVQIRAGQAIVTQTGSTIDVSGGFFRNEGGQYRTTRLLYGGNRVLNIAEATPDRIYQGVYTGESTQAFSKWGVSRTYRAPLAPLGTASEPGYVEGAAGGTLSLTAASLVLDGSMIGGTITGPQQLRSQRTTGTAQLASTLPAQGTLNLVFESQRLVTAGEPLFLPVSPTPPAIRFSDALTRTPAPAAGAPLPTDRLSEFALPTDFFPSTGFGSLNIVNHDGSFELPDGVSLELPALGRLSVLAANVNLAGRIRAPGGSLVFQASKLSRYTTAILTAQDPLTPQPALNPDRGNLVVGPRAVLDTSGAIVDDRTDGRTFLGAGPAVSNGGSISLTGFDVTLAPGSRLDVSGGLAINLQGRPSYGSAGSLSIAAGQDPVYASVIGGRLALGAELRGYAGANGMTAALGGTLAIKAPLIQVSGAPLSASSLVLEPEFFNRGGFRRFRLTGIGAPATGVLEPGGPARFLPAVWIAPGVEISPNVESFHYHPTAARLTGEPFGIVRRPFELQPATAVELAAATVRNSFRDPVTTAPTGEGLVVRGDIVVSAGSTIRVNPGGEISMRGSTVMVAGSLIAPAGDIRIEGDRAFPQPRIADDVATFARATVHIAPTARILATGTTVSVPDPFGRNFQRVLAGGNVSVFGNIVAESGAILDVSGTSALRDVHPGEVGLGASLVPPTSGLTQAPYWQQTVVVREDTDGGTITLAGHEMLLSDATLLGRAGGLTASGGTLAVSSGRYYARGAQQFGSDINLTVIQSGNVLGGGPVGVGLGVRGADGAPLSGRGYFAADRFSAGGFASLDLGFNTTPGAGRARGGNVEFSGPVRIDAAGSLRVASGGIIRANAPVRLSAAYIATGQPFLTPLTQPERDSYEYFQRDDGLPGSLQQVSPTFGPGTISFNARLIDIGTLVFQNIGKAAFNAPGGDIRGSGFLTIRGDLQLTAAQISPVTLGEFQIFAYDPAGGTGSVTIGASGRSAAPLSAGGAIRIYASRIVQGGNLVAPFGSITLGWDGEDLDPSTPQIDRPVDRVAGNLAAPPVAASVTLASGSLTTVAGIDFYRNAPLLIPFGLSPDGLSIIDPRGVDVTSTGLPQKSVTLAGNSVTMNAGSIIDIRGGGDLFASRWVSGSGGLMNLLGTPSTAFSSGRSYNAGDLVYYRAEGQRFARAYSARAALDPNDFQGAVPTPGQNRYWSEVPESYALVPGHAASYAPFAPFSTREDARGLGGSPGLVGSVAEAGVRLVQSVGGRSTEIRERPLRLGDQITLDGGNGVPAGTYTLLPRGYALLPGAFLVSPLGSTRPRSFVTAEGARIATGVRTNTFRPTAAMPVLRTAFEILPDSILAGRARYEVFGLDDFVADAAVRNDLANVQRRPGDAGYLGVHGNSALALSGRVLAQGTGGGRGGRVDISSFAPITISDSPSATGIVLNPAVLSGFGADSVFVGGLRQFGADGTSVQVRTPRLVVDTARRALTGTEILLAARLELEVAPGSRVIANGLGAAGNYKIVGDGAALLVSGNPESRITRTGTTTSTAPRLSIGAGALVSGRSLFADSSGAFSLSETAELRSDVLSLGAGQIALLLNGPTALTGTLVPGQLILSGTNLQNIQNSSSLRLLSYLSTIDIYGSGVFGSSKLGNLEFESGAVRGFGPAGSVTEIRAGRVVFSNPRNVATPPPGALAGQLAISAGEILARSGESTIQGYSLVTLSASRGILLSGTGGLFAQGSLTARTPVLTVAQGARQTLASRTGDLRIEAAAGAAGVRGGLGGAMSLRGRDVFVSADVVAPSGRIEIQAAEDLTVAGLLDARGTSREFFDVTRTTDGGEIILTSENGDVVLASTSDVSVAAASAGGDAGQIRIRAGSGQFLANGRFEGQAGAGGLGGSFELDAGSIADFGTLRDLLNAGAFNRARSFRVRTGDITVAGDHRANAFQLATDSGSITVTGRILANGVTGGRVSLIARNNVTLADGSLVTVAAQNFDSAGKGGSVWIEAGASTAGAPNLAGRVRLLDGSAIDLSVADFIAGDALTTHANADGSRYGSSAFYGQFQGTLHLRAPQINGNTDVGVESLLGSIQGASSVVVEGYRVYTPAGGVMNTALRNQINADGIAFLGAAGSAGANESAMRSRLLSGAPGAADLGTLLVLAPGAEIINLTGDLTLGLANSNGSTTPEAIAEAHTAADWDLSGFRYGSRSAPGMLTLRAGGNLVFNNALSDGFTPTLANADSGWSRLWLAPLMTWNAALPLNTQSWSFRLTAGADHTAASGAAVRALGQLGANAGSILVGEFYPADPNPINSGTSAGSGAAGQTADNLRFVTSASDSVNRGTRFEVIRTGTGNISLNAGRDVQLRNSFASIYTAGVAVPERTRIFESGDFVVPIISRSGLGITPTTPDGNLGIVQQTYPVQYSLGGGNVSVRAGADIGRFTLYNGQIIADTSRQLPTNWLYRRGQIGPDGTFSEAGVSTGNVVDASASTTWWIDFSNFFQSFGTLGGGHIDLTSGRDIINADAMLPTNARMAGRNPTTGTNLRPDAANLLEWGGGDLTVRAGNNISGGSYYVQRGTGSIFAGGEITTNSARSMSRGILAGSTPQLQDSGTWLPMVLYAGDARFDVAARGNVLVGPATNPFLLPQGMNNRFWYKTQFQTFSPTASAAFASYGGSVTHRLAVTLGDQEPQPVLFRWAVTQNLLSPASVGNNLPWLRLAETSVENYSTILNVGVPTVRSTAWGGDVNVVGEMILFPSPVGTVELLASGGIPGLQRAGLTTTNAGQSLNAWTAARVSLSDADPARQPGILRPASFQSFIGGSREQTALLDTFNLVNPLAAVTTAFRETGATEGPEAAVTRQNALHSASILHRNNPDPVRFYAAGGDISGLTIYSAQRAQILASRDITDVAFYLQNPASESVSIVSAGRDIVLFNENAPRRTLATNLGAGNAVVDPLRGLSSGANTRAMAGDVQIGGSGQLQVLAGRNIDLGTGSNLSLGGLGRGVTSVGRARNPFLPFEGASLVVMAGVSGPANTAAVGLTGSTLDFAGFLAEFGGAADSSFGEQQAAGALRLFFDLLKQSAVEAAQTGSYTLGFAAAEALFGTGEGRNVNTRSYGWGPWSSEVQTGTEGQIVTRVRDIRTTSGGDITLATPTGGIAMAPAIFGNPLTPPGIVTEFGGAVSIFMDGDLSIGLARVFTLRGGDVTIWSSRGDIAAGAAAKTVVSAPPTRVTIDRTSALLVTDLGGLATGGGIGVLASVADVEPGTVSLIAPGGTIDAGDAGIRATGDITIAAAEVINADNIAAGGSSTGVPSAPTAAAPNLGGLTSGSSATAAASSAAQTVANQAAQQPMQEEMAASVITVEVLGYGGGSDLPAEDDEREDDQA